MRSSLGMLLVIAACGADAPSAGQDPDAGDCEPPGHTDDLPLARDTALTLPGEVRRLVWDSDVALACGDSFVASVQPDSGKIRRLDLPAPCVAIAADQGRVLVATAGAGLLLVSVDGAGELTLDDGDPNIVVHDVAFDGDRALVAAADEGILVYGAAGELVRLDALGPTIDAWAIYPVAEALLVAEASGRLVLLDAQGGQLASLPGIGAPLRIVGDGTRVAVARGADGTDLVEVIGARIEPVARVTTRGVAVDVALEGDDLLVAEGAEVVRWAIRDDGSVDLVSVEQRSGAGQLLAPWFRALALRGRDALVGEGTKVLAARLGDAIAIPAIATEQTSAAAWAAPGEKETGLFRLENLGRAPLILLGLEAEPPFGAAIWEELAPPRERPGCAGQRVVAPGVSFLVELSFSPESPAPVIGSFTVTSDDPDQPRLSAALDGNSTAREVGAVAADFAVLTAAGDLEQLSNHRGRVVMIKLFNFG